MPEVNDAELLADAVAELVQANGAAGSSAPAAAAAADIRIVKGAPTDEELAAVVVAVLSAAAENGGAASDPVHDAWGHPALLHRQPAAFSPDSFAAGGRFSG
ncbi:MAG: acyl-CoA carboxylase subunit epsilon [Mycobacteriaceae bacterium]|nr:acyl-CoA carboxylase subunit epsilon [Mycobacteriaceae bacterium]